MTTYSHKDDNNLWLVKKLDRDPDETEAPEPLRHGDVIRLEHQPYVRLKKKHGFQTVGPLSLFVVRTKTSA